MKKIIKETTKKFLDSCKRSKKQAVINVVTAIAAAAALIAVIAIIVYGALRVLQVVIIALIAAAVFLPDDLLHGFWQRIAEIGKQPQPVTQYPVFFGYEGWRIVPNLVDRRFNDLYEWFSVCYFAEFSEKENRVMYIFKCCIKPDIVADYDFILLLQKAAEHILSRQLSDYGIVGVSCQDLVALDIINDNLIISFAKNNAGILETMQMQEQIRRKYLSANVSVPSAREFTDRWNEG